MSKTLADRLHDARIDKGLTQEQLAKKAQLTRIAISNIEIGLSKDTKSTNLFAIAKALNVNAEWLATGKGEPNTKQWQPQSSNVEPGPQVHQMVPEINWVQAGSWTTVAENTPLEQAKYHPCPVKCSPGTFALKVKGDSMLNRFEEGDLIFVDPERLEPQNGQFIVALMEDSNEATFKQYLELDGRKMLKALNPDYPAELRFLSINGNCRVVGTVVSHVKPVL